MSNAVSTLRRGPIVAALLIGAFVALLAQTLLNVAMPVMMIDLGISANTIQWLSTGYLLVNGVLIPVSAYLIERFSTRQLFLTAMGLFTAGTIMCAVAPNFEVVLAGRLIQATGAGILMPLMSVIFLTIFPIEERGKAMGMMGLAMIFAPAVGPTLSGWVVEHYDWRVNMYSLTTVINMIITMSMYSGMILLPIYLQSIRGFSPLDAGLLLLPGAILMGIMSPITGIIFDKIGAKWLSVAGLIITVFTTYEFSRLAIDTTYNHMILMYSLRMFGMSMLMMPIQTAGMNQLPQRLNAHGSAMSQTLRNVAGALGTAFLVTIMTNTASRRVKELIIQGKIAETDKAGVLHATRQGTIYGINHAFVIATWMTVVALALAFFIRKVKPHSETIASTAEKQ
jgi:MFS family permease